MYSVLKTPDAIRVICQDPTQNDVSVDFTPAPGALKVSVTAKTAEPRFVLLRWNYRVDGPVRILGDAWERSYGTLAWRGIEPERILPWYFLMDSPDGVFAFGVAVRPSAMCHWLCDREGITLVLDVRCGNAGVVLDGRTLEAATILYRAYGDREAFDAADDFCAAMSPSPLAIPAPVYGANNWYYAYGKSSHVEILSDSAYISRLAGGLSNRPYMVADDGWQPNGCCGPWDRGNERFPDMPRLIREMKETGVKPGLWIRPLHDASEKFTAEHKVRGEARTLDPTHPDVLADVEATLRRLSDWGCEIVKHDFSSFDTTGLWGKDAFRRFAPERTSWHFYDRTVTTAEALVTLYSRILAAAGDMVIIGCNCVNHLTAGLAHLNRTGDDTSGRDWERTRFMGVNTLAFRLPQHRHFFEIDADCVGITASVPWAKNRLWLDLLAKSSTPLFLSCKQSDITPAMEADIATALALAAEQKDSLRPLDWMETSTPAKWSYNGETIEYAWSDDFGAFELV
ncbi:MAG: hypothetical protein IJC93_07145 [Clostridia bacterium]|nr:hypothetical protein [Clostridia bacterium]